MSRIGGKCFAPDIANRNNFKHGANIWHREPGVSTARTEHGIEPHCAPIAETATWNNHPESDDLQFLNGRRRRDGSARNLWVRTLSRSKARCVGNLFSGDEEVGFS